MRSRQPRPGAQRRHRTRGAEPKAPVNGSGCLLANPSQSLAGSSGDPAKNSAGFFATVSLGSGLVFVTMLFTAAAVIGSLLTLHDQPQGFRRDSTLVGGRGFCPVGQLRDADGSGVHPSGDHDGPAHPADPALADGPRLASAALMLFSPPMTGWAELLFPGWVLVLSLHILVVSLRSPGGETDGWASGSHPNELPEETPSAA